MQSKFHWRDGWCFWRDQQGSVFVERKDIGVHLSIPAAEWVSIVAHVSARGETGASYAEALVTHEAR